LLLELKTSAADRRRMTFARVPSRIITICLLAFVRAGTGQKSSTASAACLQLQPATISLHGESGGKAMLVMDGQEAKTYDGSLSPRLQHDGSNSLPLSSKGGKLIVV